MNCSDIVIFLNCSDSVIFLNCSDSVIFLNCCDSVIFWNCSDSVPLRECFIGKFFLTSYEHYDFQICENLYDFVLSIMFSVNINNNFCILHIWEIKWKTKLCNYIREFRDKDHANLFIKVLRRVHFLHCFFGC
jgi:hypothetical protein